MKSIKDIFRSYTEFDEHGRHVNGTDKQSNHSYGDIYEKLFLIGKDGGTMRNTATMVMEVGVADGSSLLAWSEVFPNALCVGMDIHYSVRARGDRIEFHFGDQLSREDCLAAADNRMFDLIVEDAKHTLGNTLLTLMFLWPYVRPGGMYVVEEWDGVCGSEETIRSLFRNVEIVDTIGPTGGREPLVVFRKGV